MIFDVKLITVGELELNGTPNILTYSVSFGNYLKGEKGEKGDKGDAGEKGEKGDKGEDGSAVFFTTRIDENGDLIILQNSVGNAEFSIVDKNLIITL